ncbi:hypothetical protein [Photobacterium indicum]|uniref:Uncharacterized protein n=1 Tax=Photobacterium indicum TaxID=81447 RepID=A0A2T3LAE0_9GAMM|nr:hypothetical protein [Photobacterium indicum]PSV48307.1 hypothetical protein C9J47_07205 [Photobacterium indicum]
MSGNSSSMVQKIISASAWSFIGVLMAAAFFYWQEYRNPFQLNISLIDEVNLIEVKGKIQNLKVLYKNDDILESKKEIKVIRVSIENKGDTILQSYYDQLEPFGLRFYNAKILDSEVTYSNSTDLESKLLSGNVSVSEKGIDDVIFSKVIFDSGDTVTLKFTLLQDSDKSLEISPLGKLANISDLTITKFSQADDNNPWNPAVYVFIGYFLVLFTLFGLITILVFLESYSKKKKVKSFVTKFGKLSEKQNVVTEFYLSCSSRDERLVSDLIDENYALDLSDYIEKPKVKRSPMNLLFIRHSNVRVLNKDIFSIEDDFIYFNQDNEKFIVEFFTFILEK